MADNIFRVDWYVKDWLLDTAQLPPDERGVYVQIVALIYAKGGPIPPDHKWIAGVCGCSPRLVRSIVERLVDKNFLTINSDGNITQKRSENELKTKRNFLETSSKGGRTSAENRRQSKENNDLFSTDHNKSVSTPTPPHPTLSPITNNKHPDTIPREDGVGVLKNGGGLGVFRIERFLEDDDDLMAAKLAAPGWDIYNLMRIYDEGVNSGRRDRPKHPARAFIAWLPMYTKGKKP